MSNTSRVSVKKSLAEREPPRWIVILIAVIGVTILGYFGCQSLIGRDSEPGPRIKVHPGMYNLQAEVARMRAAHQAGSTSDGH